MVPEQGDIVLIPVPFTDLSSQKRRPVIVVSNNVYNRTSSDIVVVAMTSNPQFSVYSFGIESKDLKQGKLNRPSHVRVDKIYTLAQSIVLKTFGRIHDHVLDQIRTIFQEIMTPKA
jgi:mRNA interferase MazF